VGVPCNHMRVSPFVYDDSRTAITFAPLEGRDAQATALFAPDDSLAPEITCQPGQKHVNPAATRAQSAGCPERDQTC
jgi:hypothetical protein